MYRKLILLIFIFQNVCGLDSDYDGLFGDKSIIRRLRNELGSFKAEVLFFGRYNQQYDVEEKYNFKFKDGQVNITYDTDDRKELIWTYFNDFSEYYDIVKGKTCFNLINDEVIKSKLIPWTPYSTIPSKFKMLGPSHLLFALIDNYDKNKENIDCKNTHGINIRCDFYFESKTKDNSNDKIEYYFYYENDLLLPSKIISDNKKIEYRIFDYSFDGDNYRVDLKIPIGLGCEKKENSKHPKIATELGERFKLEYDIELEYLDLETKDEDVFLKTQSKFINWFMDGNFSFSIFDRFDLEAYKKVRTYLDGESKLAYDIYDGKCVKYNFKDGFNRNWIDKLYDLSLLPHFFFINYNLKFSGISYLDEYELDNQIYDVFEAKQYNYFVPKYYDEQKQIRTPLYSVVTHYYSKSNNKIPKLIEIRIRAIYGKLLGILKIKINKHNLALSSNSFNETIDLNRCFKNLKSTDYKELNLIFQGPFNLSLNDFNENYIKYEFRNLLDKNSIGSNFHLSPLRIHQISLDKGKSNFLKLKAKILEPIDNANYFNTIEDLTLDDGENMYGNSRIIKNINNQELCSRLCIQIVDCAAYSFNKSKICKLWTDKHYFGDIDNNYGFEWDRILTKSEINSVLGKKLIKFYRREHLPTNYTLNFIEELIKENKFHLILKKSDNDKGIKFNYIKKLESDKIDFRKYILYFILAIVFVSAIAFIIKI